MSTIDAQIDRAMMEVNVLSNIAKASGDLPTMYAANRAWRQLFDAREDLTKRRAALTPAECCRYPNCDLSCQDFCTLPSPCTCGGERDQTAAHHDISCPLAIPPADGGGK